MSKLVVFGNSNFHIYRNNLINAQYVPGLVHRNPVFYINIVEIKAFAIKEKDLQV